MSASVERRTETVPLLIGEQVEAYGRLVREATFREVAELLRKDGLPMSAGLLEAQLELEEVDRRDAARRPASGPADVPAIAAPNPVVPRAVSEESIDRAVRRAGVGAYFAGVRWYGIAAAAGAIEL
ncbi:hypothetical protein OG331_31970 [Streptomyces sp. NBC_01017]|uniref:hypothetical protein n=1 Tax=Streptomyces sp. NBC_01017 TaxID=2903721 RepID=UPI00386CAF40|nr:hypothetical protein OG331_31970 [Streptomyces sp. NBC_01017]